MPTASPFPRVLHYGSPVNPASPLNRGLVSWWKVLPQQLGGVIWRDLTNRNPGTLKNMGASSATSGWGVTSRRGGWGEVRFDVALPDAHVLCAATPSLNITGDLTIALWMWLTSFGGGSFGRMVDHRQSGNGYSFYVDNASVAGGGGLGFNVNAAATYGQDWAETAAGVVTTGTWQHVAVTVKSASAVTFYVNGAAVAGDAGSGALTQAIGSTAGTLLKIGGPPGGIDRDFDGRMDDIRLWNRVLGANEVRVVYQQSQVGDPRELRWTRSSFAGDAGLWGDEGAVWYMSVETT